MSFATALGAYLLSVLLAGRVYDHEAHIHPMPSSSSSGANGSTEKDPTCHGATCFRLAFLTSAGLCGAALLGAVYLTFRTWRPYRLRAALDA